MFGQNFSWRDAVSVVLALIGMGTAWIANHQTAVITVVVMVVVWIINTLAKRYGVHFGRRWLTVILYALAVVLEVIFEPVSVPMLPLWSGDASLYAEQLVAWVGSVAALGAGITAGATVLYNTLLAEVGDKVADALIEA